MKIILIRLFGGLLIILSSSLFYGGSWPSMVSKLSLETYQSGKNAIVFIGNNRQDYGLINEDNAEKFEEEFKTLKRTVAEYYNDNVTKQKILPYFFSIFSLLLGVCYLVAGIGVLRLKDWAKKAGIIGASAWPIFYLHILFTFISFFKFLDNIAASARNLLTYINLTSNPFIHINILSDILPNLIFAAIIALTLFTILPLWFFLTTTIDDELL